MKVIHQYRTFPIIIIKSLANNFAKYFPYFGKKPWLCGYRIGWCSCDTLGLCSECALELQPAYNTI